MTLVYGPLIGGEGSPLGKAYLSVDVTEGGVERQLVAGTRILVEIRKDGVLIARAGCNELSGGVMLDDGVLRFDQAIQTQMGCGPEREAQDDWFFDFILEPRWSVEGDTLTLDGSQATGSTGSSSFTATVTREDGTLTFTDLTVIPADPSARLDARAAAFEDAVLANLRTPLTHTIKSNHLKLRDPTGTTGLNLKAPRPEGVPYFSF